MFYIMQDVPAKKKNKADGGCKGITGGNKFDLNFLENLRKHIYKFGKITDVRG